MSVVILCIVLVLVVYADGCSSVCGGVMEVLVV